MIEPVSTIGTFSGTFKIIPSSWTQLQTILKEEEVPGTILVIVFDPALLYICLSVFFLYLSRQLQFPGHGCPLTTSPSFGKRYGIMFWQIRPLSWPIFRYYSSYWMCMSFYTRCKELVLATVRAFFDLIDPETRQVRTNTILMNIFLKSVFL